MTTKARARVTAAMALAIVAADCSSSRQELVLRSRLLRQRVSQSGQRYERSRCRISTGMAPPVQQQLREQFEMLSRIEADATVVPDKRAAAYGDLGKLLLATESFGDAETCFLNAVELNSADTRWGYYLAQVYRLQGESQQGRPITLSARFRRGRTISPRSCGWATSIWIKAGPSRRGRCSRERWRSMHATRLRKSAWAASPSLRATMPKRSSISRRPWRSIAARPAFTTRSRRRIAVPDRSNAPMRTCGSGDLYKSDHPIR